MVQDEAIYVVESHIFDLKHCKVGSMLTHRTFCIGEQNYKIPISFEYCHQLDHKYTCIKRFCWKSVSAIVYQSNSVRPKMHPVLSRICLVSDESELYKFCYLILHLWTERKKICFIWIYFSKPIISHVMAVLLPKSRKHS